MADHRYQTDVELTRRLKTCRRAQMALREEIATLEESLGIAKRDLNNQQIKAQWLVHYLAQPEGQRLSTEPDIGVSGELY